MKSHAWSLAAIGLLGAAALAGCSSGTASNPILPPSLDPSTATARFPVTSTSHVIPQEPVNPDTATARFPVISTSPVIPQKPVNPDTATARFPVISTSHVIPKKPVNPDTATARFPVISTSHVIPKKPVNPDTATARFPVISTSHVIPKKPVNPDTATARFPVISTSHVIPKKPVNPDTATARFPVISTSHVIPKKPVNPDTATARFPVTSTSHQMGSSATASSSALSTSGNGSVVFSPTHSVCSVQFGQQCRFAVDLNRDRREDFMIRASYRMACPAFVCSNDDNVEVIPSEGNGVFSVLMNPGFAAALKAGQIIGPIPGFVQEELLLERSSNTRVQGTWYNAGAHYVGLEFLVNGALHYGWAKLQITGPVELLGQGSVTVTMSGFAYASAAGTSILAGASQ